MALNRETNFGFGLTIAAIVRRLAECEFRPAAARQSCRTGPDIPRSPPERELLSCLALDRRRLTRRREGQNGLILADERSKMKGARLRPALGRPAGFSWRDGRPS